MFAVFNRFNRAWEEAARDLGASPWQTFRHIVLPIIAAERDRRRRCSASRCPMTSSPAPCYTAGSDNTLPLEIFGMTTNVTTPVLYALGTVTTGAVVPGDRAGAGLFTWVRRRRQRHGSDAGKAA